jgi:hypothetical protein
MRGPKLTTERNDSPFRDTGYSLREVGPLTPGLIGRHKVRHGFASTTPRLPKSRPPRRMKGCRSC